MSSKIKNICGTSEPRTVTGLCVFATVLVFMLHLLQHFMKGEITSIAVDSIIITALIIIFSVKITVVEDRKL